MGWILAQRRLALKQLLEGASILFTGAVAGLFGYLAAVWPFRHLADETSPGAEWYVCLAAPLFLLIVQAGGTLYVGVTSRGGKDEDREWSARFGAWLLIATAAWSVLSLVVVFGPPFLFYLGPKARLAMGSLGGIAVQQTVGPLVDRSERDVGAALRDATTRRCVGSGLRRQFRWGSIRRRELR